MLVLLELLDKSEYSFLKSSNFYLGLPNRNIDQEIEVKYICSINETNIELFGNVIAFWGVDNIPTEFLNLIKKKIDEDTFNKIRTPLLTNENLEIVEQSKKILRDNIGQYLKNFIKKMDFDGVNFIFETYKPKFNLKHAETLIGFAYYYTQGGGNARMVECLYNNLGLKLTLKNVETVLIGSIVVCDYEIIKFLCEKIISINEIDHPHFNYIISKCGNGDPNAKKIVLYMLENNYNLNNRNIEMIHTSENEIIEKYTEKYQ